MPSAKCYSESFVLLKEAAGGSVGGAWRRVAARLLFENLNPQLRKPQSVFLCACTWDVCKDALIRRGLKKKKSKPGFGQAIDQNKTSRLNQKRTIFVIFLPTHPPTASGLLPLRIEEQKITQSARFKPRRPLSAMRRCGLTRRNKHTCAYMHPCTAGSDRMAPTQPKHRHADSECANRDTEVGWRGGHEGQGWGADGGSAGMTGGWKWEKKNKRMWGKRMEKRDNKMKGTSSEAQSRSASPVFADAT